MDTTETAVAGTDSMTRSDLEVVLGPVGPDFDPTRHVALGPWCFAGAEDVYPNWTDLEFVRTFDRAEKEHAAEMTFRLSGHWIVTLTDRLNARHGKSYSEHYWRVLLIPWVLWVVDMTWRAYVHAQCFIARYGAETLAFSRFDREADWDFRDYPDFYERGFTGAEFSAWLYSRVLDDAAPAHWRRIETPFAPPPYGNTQASPATAATPGLLKRLRKSFTDRLAFTQVYGVHFEKLLFSALIAVLPRRPAPSLYQIPREYDPRTEFPAGYLDLLADMMETMMPRYLRGDFAALEARASAARFTAGRLHVGAPDVSDISERFRVAMAVESGAKVVISQHGGGYGTFAMNGDAAQGEYVQHGFVTWGWTHQGDYPVNAIPLPSPALSKLAGKHRNRNDDLILVGTRMTVASPRLVSAPEPVDWPDYREQKRRFVETLGDGPRTRLRYRPYGRDKNDLADADYLERYIPDLVRVVGDLEPAMLGCRVLVVDHPTTTLHLALAAEVPTMAYWDDDAWPMCRQAEPIFAAMRDAGILHDDGAAAAAKVNEIWDDVEGWWQSAPVVEARRMFCENHARTSRMWWWHWARALSRL